MIQIMRAFIGAIALSLTAGLGLLAGAWADEAPAQPAVAKACCEDLAKRVGVAVGEVSVERLERVTWPDAALGLPQADKAYAQVLTSGWALVLQSPKGPYLYTASETRLRYGGPVQAWGYSVLLMLPIADEPNMNCDLVQVSLMGTNPKVLLSGVDSFRTQRNGSVLATRRTSRSGYDLLYLAPGATDEQKLGGAFYFGDGAVNAEGTEWLAFRRPGVGGGWEVAGNKVEGDPQAARSVELPEGTRPGRLYWEEDGRIVAVLVAGEANVAWELQRDGEKWSWLELGGYSTPEADDLMLNKSASMVVELLTEDGKPVTRVASEWFTGDVTREVLLKGFAMKAFQLTPCKRFVVLSGVEGETAKVLALDFATGEKFVCGTEFRGDAQLFLAPPRDYKRIPVLREP